eukprot:SAG22_NODE_2277_length_2762_cov_2.747278_1_plen_122_part_00
MAVTPTCEVCLEAVSEARPRFVLPQLRTGNGDVLRDADCGHNICTECMVGFATSRVRDQKVFGIKCPHEGCGNEFYEQDVKRLAESRPVAAGSGATDAVLEPAIYAKFCELRQRNYTAGAA